VSESATRAGNFHVFVYENDSDASDMRALTLFLTRVLCSARIASFNRWLFLDFGQNIAFSRSVVECQNLTCRSQNPLRCHGSLAGGAQDCTSTALTEWQLDDPARVHLITETLSAVAPRGSDHNRRIQMIAQFRNRVLRMLKEHEGQCPQEVLHAVNCFCRGLLGVIRVPGSLDPGPTLVARLE
jgi:hypothetical protein